MSVPPPIALFQSTLPQGEWQLFLYRFPERFRFQSTLPQGEWHLCSPPRFLICLFQSTLPQGEWLRLDNICRNQQWFQSTLPQGEWPPYWHNIRYPIDHFNPHSRKGSDSGRCRLRMLIHSNFNPHSRKGSDATRCFNALVCWIISIHTPARGVTAKLHDFYLKTKYFYQFYLICFWCYSYFYRILKRFNLCKQIFRCESLSVFLNT